ncbi:MAG: hypothetical protein LBI18_10695 [Planctomycetaceae bacterium]|nr:hypothetical protein [Planctomycetaceae bacterium]
MIRSIFLFCFCLFFMSGGCFRGQLDLPKLYPVTVSVVMNGQPVEQATVACFPKDGSEWFAGGVTGADGTVRLQTKGRYNGIPSGDYKVVVIKLVQAENSTEEHPRMYRAVHSQYERKETTPLVCLIEKNTRTLEFVVEAAPARDLVDP